HPSLPLFSPYISPSVFYALSLHDALPISTSGSSPVRPTATRVRRPRPGRRRRAIPGYSAASPNGPGRAGTSTETCRSQRNGTPPDRKSTRLNSSHDQSSYAVFCLKKKNGSSFNQINQTDKNGAGPTTQSFTVDLTGGHSYWESGGFGGSGYVNAVLVEPAVGAAPH